MDTAGGETRVKEQMTTVAQEATAVNTETVQAKKESTKK